MANYPAIGGGEPGKVISIFGLSGSGKSTALEALREMYGSKAVEMDSDTVRFNLLGKMIADVETQNGANMDDVRSNLMHNNISGTLYLILHHISKTLQSRGYTILRSSTMPETNAEKAIYIGHPDGIGPRSITEDTAASMTQRLFEQTGLVDGRYGVDFLAAQMATKLFERTQQRTDGVDNFDWENAKTITRFEDMIPVAVQVPEQVHAIFVKNIRHILQNPPKNFAEITNERTGDPAKRKAHSREQFEKILG